MRMGMTRVWAAAKWGMLMLMALWLLCGCAIHEFPDEPLPPGPVPETPFTGILLELRHATEMPLYASISGMPQGRSRDTGKAYDIRYTINLYPAQPSLRPSQRGSDSRSPLKTFVFSAPAFEGLDHDFKLEVEPGEYSVMAWVDYVEAGTTADCFYDTSDFTQIELAKTHVGCEDAREAFRGIGACEVREGSATELTLEMVRPMARFCIIATDLHEFVEMAEAKLEANGRADDDARGNESRDNGRGIDIDNYRVVMHYAGFMPSVFNMFMDHPADSRTGVKFEGAMRMLSDDELELGYDYVITNGKSTSTNVRVDVCDKHGNVLVSSPPVSVPLLRGHYTEVRGKFLTSSSASAPTISPDFDGEYNILIK